MYKYSVVSIDYKNNPMFSTDKSNLERSIPTLQMFTGWLRCFSAISARISLQFVNITGFSLQILQNMGLYMITYFCIDFMSNLWQKLDRLIGQNNLWILCNFEPYFRNIFQGRYWLTKTGWANSNCTPCPPASYLPVISSYLISGIWSLFAKIAQNNKLSAWKIYLAVF